MKRQKNRYTLQSQNEIRQKKEYDPPKSEGIGMLNLRVKYYYGNSFRVC